MNLTLSGHHVEITSSIRSYTMSKLERVKRHFDHVIDISVILSVQKLIHKAEVYVHISGKDIFVESHGGDMYVAIDSLVDKLDRQILKHKERGTAHRDHHAGKYDIP